MSKTKSKSKDPDALETKLVAEEAAAEQERKRVVHPPWVYYYINLLTLLFLLTVLITINFSQSPEPVFLTSSKNMQETKPAAQPSTAVNQDTGKSTDLSKRTEADRNNSSRNLTYTPEELLRTTNEIRNDTSDEMIVVKAEVASLLGWYDSQQKLIKEGLDLANQSNKSNPENPLAQRALALANFADGKFEKTRSILSRFQNNRFDPLQDWMNACILLIDGRNQQAIRKLEQIRTSNPNFYPASYVLMQQYLKQNEISSASTIAKFWKGKSLSNIGFVRIMVEILDRQQDYASLDLYLRNYETVYPKDWNVIFYLGKSNAKLQKRELAKVYFKKIMDTPESYSVDQIGLTNYELGKIALYEKAYKESIQYLFEASQRIPDDMNIRLYLASAYFKMEDYEKSIDVYKQVLSKNNHDPKTYVYLGMSYYELGQNLIAEKYLNQAFGLNPDDPLLLYYLAKVEERNGAMDKAQTYLQKAIALDPQNNQAKKMLQRLNQTSPAPTAPAP